MTVGIRDVGSRVCGDGWMTRRSEMMDWRRREESARVLNVACLRVRFALKSSQKKYMEEALKGGGGRASSLCLDSRVSFLVVRDSFGS